MCYFFCRFSKRAWRTSSFSPNRRVLQAIHAATDLSFHQLGAELLRKRSASLGGPPVPKERIQEGLEEIPLCDAVLRSVPQWWRLLCQYYITLYLLIIVAIFYTVVFCVCRLIYLLYSKVVVIQTTTHLMIVKSKISSILNNCHLNDPC